MKIFQRMQNRIKGSNGKNKPSSISATHHYMVHEASKQEFSDWPQELLAIGTFGNKNLKEETASFKDCTHKFSLEEVGNLENELNINLEEEQEEEIDDNFYTSNNLVYSSRGRERCLDSSKTRGASKKSLSFLFKKLFVCKSGSPSTPTPKFIDPLSTGPRMEKILRAILHKKIHPQSSRSSSTTVLKKYPEKNSISQSDDDEDEEEFAANVNEGIKWVKTDSEYIVLEI